MTGTEEQEAEGGSPSLHTHTQMAPHPLTPTPISITIAEADVLGLSALKQGCGGDVGELISSNLTKLRPDNTVELIYGLTGGGRGWVRRT